MNHRMNLNKEQKCAIDGTSFQLCKSELSPPPEWDSELVVDSAYFAGGEGTLAFDELLLFALVFEVFVCLLVLLALLALLGLLLVLLFDRPMAN